MNSLPVHVAIIMDGNGRWARQRGLARTEGHRVGAGRVREVVEKCLELGIKYLTIYAFSKENWKRPEDEVNGIMKLTEFFFNREFRALRNKGVYFVHLGEREGLSPSVLRIIERIEKENSQEKKLFLNIAFNYSGRSEIAQACKKIALAVEEGKLDPLQIDEKLIESYIYTEGMPDPDLLIRTGGEMRISNFLLWQLAYSEIWVTDVLWPDFTPQVFSQAICNYMERDRRFGRVCT